MAVTYTQPFVLTTAEGTFGNGVGVDIWRCTWKIAFPFAVAPSTSALQAYVDAVRPAVINYHGASAVQAGNTTYLGAIAAANIGIDGKYIGGGLQSTVRSTNQTPVAGVGTPVHPLSVALCISLGSARARGRASRGRIYWPARAISVDAQDGRISTTAQDGIRNTANTFLAAINTAAATHLGSGFALSLMSGLGSGTTAPVTRVSIGRRVDVQERREGELSEAHVWSPVEGTARATQEFERDYEETVRAEMEDRYADLPAWSDR